MFYSLFSLLRPTVPSLFPYTTLFRSRALHIRCDSHGGGRRCRWPRAPAEDPVGPGGHDHCHGGDRCRQTGRDRKSTRLNSSHVAISYAVFCLKKKTTNPEADNTRYI